jgi:hypothetical protein
MNLNCACDDEYPKATMETLRVRLMRRLGFSAQVASPPPGMSELLRDFLTEAQELVYSGYNGYFQHERWFTWSIVSGTRFYDFGDGADPEQEDCEKRLNPNMIQWVGVSEDGRSWQTLTRGINQLQYDHERVGRPERYDLGSCIELWPEPDTNDYKLRVYGMIGLMPFTDDAHFTTIDQHMVFLRALTNAKAHYKQPDWQNYIEQERIRMGELVMATHTGKRYITRSKMCGCNHDNPGVSGPVGIRFEEDGSIRYEEV